MPKHSTSYIFSLVLLSAHGFLYGEETSDENFIVSEETASVFGFGAAPTKDNSQKAATTEGCKTGTTCKVKLEKCDSDIPSQLLYFKHIEAKGIGYKKGYSTVGAFLTPYTMFADFLPFADLRGHVFNDGKFAANAGLGVKYLSNHPFVFGAGVYYDFRQVRKTHFNQVSLSLETLARRWEARLNGYLPVGSKKHVQTKSESVGYNFDHFAGHHLFYNETFFVKKRTEFAMKGADAEFGWHLLKPQEDYTLYAAAGPYYYNGERKHAWGGKVRVEGRVTPYVTLEVSDSYDNIFHNIVQGQVSINVPFGGKIQKKSARFKTSCSTALSMEARMMRPMNRQEIIVAHSERKHFFKTVDPIAFSPAGVPINIQFVNPNATSPGDGTFENPFAQLPAAQAASLPGDVFYVYPGTNTLTTAFILVENQSLFGSSTAQTIPVLVAPNQVIALTIPAQTSGLPSIISNGMGGNSVIRFNGDNVIVSGFNITQNDNDAIFDNFFTPINDYKPLSNVTIINNILTQNVSHSGIFLQNISGNNTISNNQFLTNGNGGAGIFLQQEDLTVGNYTLNQNTITGWTGGDGAIVLQCNRNDGGNSQTTIAITNNTLNNNTSGTSGLVIETFGHAEVNATVLNNFANTNAGDGIVFIAHADSEIGCTVNGNTCLSNGFHGIEIDPLDNSTVTGIFNNNTLNSNSFAGIGFDTPGSQNQVSVSFTGTITNNTCNDNQRAGIYFAAGSNNVGQQHFTIANNTMVGNGSFTAGYTFIVENAPNSNTCLKLVNNFNTGLYVIANDSSNTFLLESTAGNEGLIDYFDGRSSFSSNPLFRVVEDGTCAP
ncbi:MAG: right-handed parallel beta-helix repeat-containing protein [Verrucomicrobia bacterium]|nr:right-handed parallel beta-helix repeat-containing protein [Verrucomicrobiota bacterium]